MEIDIRDELRLCLEGFIEVYKKDKYSRYKSYDHCRKCFLENFNKTKEQRNYDFVALNLFAFLGSYGMFRKSFLMQRDYKFNIELVKILYQEQYKVLVNFNPFEGNYVEKIDLILDLKKEIRDYYVGKEYIEDGEDAPIRINNATDTLVSKIIMGTFGCVPAYDKYVHDYALPAMCIKNTFSRESLVEIIEKFKNYNDVIAFFCEEINCFANSECQYPPMKAIDIYLWEKGYKISKEKNRKNS